MNIGIVIIHYGQWELLVRCLAALDHASSEDQLEVVVIDNASPTALPHDASKRIHDAFHGSVSLVCNTNNVGFGRACNQGTALMPGKDAYLLLNPDVEMEPGSLRVMAQYLEEHATVGIIGPRLTYEDGTIQDSYRRFPRPLDQLIKRTPLHRSRLLRERVRTYLMWDKDKERTEQVDWLVGACILVRAEAWNRIGGFDERFFLFYEDVDLCRRMEQAGYQVVYLPSARALHRKERLSDGGLLSIFTKRTLRIHLLSALKYFWKWRKWD